jgi:hypothetical protein
LVDHAVTFFNKAWKIHWWESTWILKNLGSSWKWMTLPVKNGQPDLNIHDSSQKSRILVASLNCWRQCSNCFESHGSSCKQTGFTFRDIWQHIIYHGVSRTDIEGTKLSTLKIIK